MLLNRLVYLLSFLATLILTLVIYLSNRKSKINITFASMLVTILGWLASLYFFYNIHDDFYVLVLGRFNFSVVFWLATLVFYFTYLFPVKTFNINGLIHLLILGESTLLSLITLLTPLVDRHEIISGSSRITIYGSLYPLFVFHFLFYVIACIVVLFFKYKALRGRGKLQIKFLLLGIVLAVVWGTVTNIFIPLISGHYDIQNYGVIAPVILAVFTGYAIARHRLMDIRLVILRLVVYTLISFP